jgi:glyoxylase-like metal-dependent hydrolase (beta-lactamase superfamily II)
METPDYQVTNWAGDGQLLVDSRGDDLGLTLYQTPGHTPDQLAVWDTREKFLFVGDTIYERSAIIFPAEGSITAYSATIGRLKKLVQEWNQGSGKKLHLLIVSQTNWN